MSMYDERQFFATYFQRATEKQVFVAKLAQALADTPAGAGSHLSLLDLGCHSGELTRWYLTELERLSNTAIDLTGVEPSADAVARFTALPMPAIVRSKKPVQATAEEYFSAHPRIFDWVVASHCLYWSADLETTVLQIRAAGKRGLIVLRERTGIFEIQSRFRHHLGNPREQLYQADDIEKILTKNNVTFRRQSVVSEVALPAAGTDDERYMIGFFLQRDQKSLTEDIRSEVSAWLSSRQGILPHHVAFFWI